MPYLINISTLIKLPIMYLLLNMGNFKEYFALTDQLDGKRQKLNKLLKINIIIGLNFIIYVFF